MVSRPSLLQPNSFRQTVDPQVAPSPGQFMPYLNTGANTSRSSQLQISINDNFQAEEFQVPQESQGLFHLNDTFSQRKKKECLNPESSLNSSKRLIPLQLSTLKSLTPSRRGNSPINKLLESLHHEDESSNPKNKDCQATTQSLFHPNSNHKTASSSKYLDFSAESSKNKLPVSSSKKKLDLDQDSRGCNSISKTKTAPASKSKSKFAKALSPLPQSFPEPSWKLKEATHQSVKSVQPQKENRQLNGRHSNVSSKVSLHAIDSSLKKESCFGHLFPSQQRPIEDFPKSQASQKSSTVPNSPQLFLQASKTRGKSYSNDNGFPSQPPKIDPNLLLFRKDKSSTSKASIIRKPSHSTSKTLSKDLTFSLKPEASTQAKFSLSKQTPLPSTGSHTRQPSNENLAICQPLQPSHRMTTESQQESMLSDRLNEAMGAVGDRFRFVKEGKKFHVHPILDNFRSYL